jgi:hypothetical protein
MSAHLYGVSGPNIYMKSRDNLALTRPLAPVGAFNMKELTLNEGMKTLEL